MRDCEGLLDPETTLSTFRSILPPFYKSFPSVRHHQASAGGSSISQLHEAFHFLRDTTGFSRWYFNFSATLTLPAVLLAARLVITFKLTLHRLKLGGVPRQTKVFK